MITLSQSGKTFMVLIIIEAIEAKTILAKNFGSKVGRFNSGAIGKILSDEFKKTCKVETVIFGGFGGTAFFNFKRFKKIAYQIRDIHKRYYNRLCYNTVMDNMDNAVQPQPEQIREDPEQTGGDLKQELGSVQTETKPKLNSMVDDSVFQVFGKARAVEFDEELAKQQINMNPTEKRVVEPLTGSSVVFDASSEQGVPENGFPAGYGPNAGIKRIEKPVKPKLRERIKRSFGQMTKRQKRLLVIIPSVSIVLIVTLSLIAMVTGIFATDYSKTYSVAKTIRGELQKIRSNANCEKVIEYNDNTFTSMEIYQGYVEECKKVSRGISEQLIEEMGDTAGVLKDVEVNRRFEAFKVALNEGKKGNSEMEKTLDLYLIWHSWILTEASGDKTHNGFEWSEDEIKEAAKILVDSSNDKLVEYGKRWVELKTEAAKAAYKFYHSGESTEVVDYMEAKNDMEAKKTAFSEFQKTKRPDVVTEFPLQQVDLANISVKFEEMYSFIRETYQKNYNKRVGGCKELINAIICD